MSSRPHTFAVKKVFSTIQGEGFYAGTPAVFIRFAGCNLNCWFCDTDFTGGDALSLDELCAAAVNSFKCPEENTMGHRRPELVVLTGGEPGLQVTRELVDALHETFPNVAIESNGTVPLKHLELDHVVVSPKTMYDNRRPLVENEVDEVRFVVGHGQPLPRIPKELKLVQFKYLSPMTDPEKEGPEAFIKLHIDWCVELVKRHASDGWRLSLQTHKLLGIE